MVAAEIYEVRFAYSGKVAGVAKSRGDTVKKWERIASLDRKSLQIDLDRNLADYEKARAEFELFRIKFGEGGDDTTKFLRQEKQAQLNASVKEVELAKYRLDQADIVSPVEGTILDMEGLVAGIYVSPASNPVKITAHTSFRFRFEIMQKDLSLFAVPTQVTITVPERTKKYSANTIAPFWGNKGVFTIEAVISGPTGLLHGMNGTLTT